MTLDEFFLSDKPDLIDGEYTVDEKAKQEYIEAATMLTMLGFRQQYKLQLDNPEKPYFMHAVWVTWIDDDWPEIEAKPISDIIAKFDTMIIDGGEWQLNKVIYKRKEK